MSVSLFIIGFQCKTHSHLVGTLGLSNGTGDVGIGGQLYDGILCFFSLDFAVGHILYTVIGYSSAQDDGITFGQCLHHGIMHFHGSGDIDAGNQWALSF